MPVLYWEHACCGNADWSAAAACEKCGAAGSRSRWGLTIHEAMARYQLQYGLKPVGAHRQLADGLIGQSERKCEACNGQGVVASLEPPLWAVCGACRGYGGGSFPNTPELVAVRARVAEEYPDALTEDAGAADADSFMSVLMSGDVPVYDLVSGEPFRLSPESRERERILAAPDTWGSLDTVTLQDVLWHALVMYGMSQDAERVEPVRDFYEICMTRLSAAERTEVISRLAEYIEQSGREGRPVSTAAFLPAMQLDMDGRVVSTAALSAAVLAGPVTQDAMAGPRNIYATALAVPDEQRRAWIISGLVMLGDAESLMLLRGCWGKVNEEDREVLSFSAGWLPYLSVVDFLLTWAEDALTAGDEPEMARALGALAHVGQVARGDVTSPQSGEGIHVIRRHFPAWASPADDVIRIERSMSIAETRPLVEPRLRALSQREKEAPSVAKRILEQWR